MTAALGFIGVLFAARQGVWWSERSVGAGSADFYQVIPHHVMVTLFGAVSILVTIALVVSCRRFWRDMNVPDQTGPLSLKGGSHTRNIHHQKH